jgi:GrpB-like predicted nucleotidyltransferase (UPF0157 family)
VLDSTSPLSSPAGSTKFNLDDVSPPPTAMSRSDRIRVVAYDPRWPAAFAEQAGAMRLALGGVAVRIDHIGSTAVWGLAAKPIVDLQISVASFEPLNAFRLPLAGLGYVFRAANEERTKRYFREPPGTRRTHIHVRRAGSFSEQLALLFRDFMRAHPDWAQRYAELKLALAENHPNDRQRYTETKRPFTWEALAAADEWAQRTGWLPGPSDA